MFIFTDERSATRVRWVCRFILTGLIWLFFVSEASAHGERAQLASMRMRTLHWFDIQVHQTQVEVGDMVTITGKFIPSEFWPDHLPGIDDAVYLNVGVPGPTFLRLHSTINGVQMVRSTALEKGKLYEFEMQLRARVAGRYHLHPLLNVKDVGSLVGKGTWVEVLDNNDPAPFVNEIQTMQGNTINLETYGMESVKLWHAIWVVLGVAYLAFWLVRKEMFIPRFIFVDEANASGDDPNKIITRRDFRVTAGFFVVTLTLILSGYLYTESRYPITIPLQTGKVPVTGLEVPLGPLDIKIDKASYQLGGRTLIIDTHMTNRGDMPVYLSEFATANIRFMNPEAKITMPVGQDEEMVSRDGLSVSVANIEPGQSIDVRLTVSDSLWESQQMTGLIHSPDSVFAGLVFYQGAGGEQYYQELGGTILPSFF